MAGNLLIWFSSNLTDREFFFLVQIHYGNLYELVFFSALFFALFFFLLFINDIKSDIGSNIEYAPFC